MHHRFPVIAWIVASVSPPDVSSLNCAEERFAAGERQLPTYVEAVAQCKVEERHMTHPKMGEYELQRSCYDASPPGTHGEWLYGRISLDVIERRSGDAYTFETLWMCKPR